MFRTLSRCVALTLTALSMGLIACSGSTEFENAGGTSEEAEGIIAITNKTIAGVSQKGPFVTGSTVTLKETEGSNLNPTGKEFFAIIRNDKGEFKIDNISLESQFVRLTARGYYIGEYLGKSSDCEVSLNAASDLSKRDETNINIFTHLQYDRILQLVKKGRSFTNAHKQANEELMKVFGYEDYLEDAENLDITGKSDADAALMYISTLFDEYFTEDLSENNNNGSEKHCLAVQKTLDNMATEFSSKGKISQETLRPFAEKILHYLDAYDDTHELSNNFIGAFFEDKCTAENEMAYHSLEPIYGKDVYDPDMVNEILGAYVVCRNGNWEIYELDNFNPKYVKVEHEIGSMTDPRNGKVYRTTSFTYNKINYEWMADDLDFKDIDTPVATSCNFFETEKVDCPAKYTWTQAMNLSPDLSTGPVDPSLVNTPHQGVCPDGWHIPESKEWNDLIRYVGVYENLKSNSLNALEFNAGDVIYQSYPSNKDLLNFDMTSHQTAPIYTIWPTTPHTDNSDFFAILVSGDIYDYPVDAHVRCVKNY